MLRWIPVLFACILGCSPPPEALPVPKRIFFITVDTLRADHLGHFGYPRETSPNLDRLAARGAVFEHAIAQWPKTTPSFASLFTGRYPRTTGLTHRSAARLGDSFRTLPETLREAGFTTVATVSNPILAADLGWGQGFDEYLETWSSEPSTADPIANRPGVQAPRVNALAMPLLERHSDADKLFVWLHYSDPHTPYILPDGVENPFLGDSLDQDDEVVEGRLTRARALGSERRLGHYVAQYDANIRVADRHIGAMLSLAGKLGLLEHALVVFTSDHGEALGEHEAYFRHSGVPYNVCAHVPLIISYPGVLAPGVRISRPVELLDLYPTLTELAAPGSGQVDLEGGSLLALLQASPSTGEADTDSFRFAFSEAGTPARRHVSVQDGRWRLLARATRDGRGDPARLQLFDLAADPLEQRNLAGDHPEEVRRLRAELRAWMRTNPPASEQRGPAPGESDESLDALRAMGYLD